MSSYFQSFLLTLNQNGWGVFTSRIRLGHALSHVQMQDRPNGQLKTDLAWFGWSSPQLEN
jgi:hypothetical protein